MRLPVSFSTLLGAFLVAVFCVLLGILLVSAAARPVPGRPAGTRELLRTSPVNLREGTELTTLSVATDDGKGRIRVKQTLALSGREVVAF